MNISSSRPIRAVILTGRARTRKLTDRSEGETPGSRLDYLSEGGVTAIVRDRNESLINPLANVNTFYAGFDPMGALRILLFERKADIIVGCFEYTVFLILLLRRLFFFRPRMLLLDVSPRGWWIRDRILDLVLSRVDYIITLSTNSSEYVQRCYRPRCPVRVLSQGVDEVFYRPLERKQQFDIASVGDDWSRDFATLLEATRTLSCSLVLKTSRPVSVPPEMSHRVTLISERISYENLRELYAAARVVCVPLKPSDNPGGINTILEAMAMGKAIVASDHGTTRDHLSDGRDGLVVPPRDPLAMRKALERLLANPGLAAELGERARARVMRDFAKPVRNRRLAVLLRDAAGAAPWLQDAPDTSGHTGVSG
ncbi:MAG: glycosyltransferase family 4 protein [Acetobacteraceae bacterium]